MPHGLRIIGATLTPFEDTFQGTPLYGYYTPEKEKMRAGGQQLDPRAAAPSTP